MLCKEETEGGMLLINNSGDRIFTGIYQYEKPPLKEISVVITLLEKLHSKGEIKDGLLEIPWSTVVRLIRETNLSK